MMSTLRAAQRVHWILRAAVAAEFVGHGAFGIITKAAWLPYFAAVGVPPWLAWTVMPLVGTWDITMGLLTLIRPTRAALLYMAVWGFWTALLRPLAGEGVWELFERAGNFGVPLAFLWLSGPVKDVRQWFTLIAAQPVPRVRAEQVAWILRLTTSLLLIGHGGFGAAMGKPEWLGYFGVVGGSPGVATASELAPRLGWFEMALGLLVLLHPTTPVLVFVFAWKVGTELLRPLAVEPFWEFLERGGSYAAPLALLYVRGMIHGVNASAKPDPSPYPAPA